MFENLESMSQEDLIARKEALESENEKLNQEIKTINKKLRKGLIWWIICIPLIGIAIYQIALGRRIEHDHEAAGELGARKFRQSKITIELMKIKTLIIEK